MSWTIVVPVKGAIGAKTRLGAVLDESARGRLAIAFARDTITAALRTPAVSRVVVVTDETELDDLSYAPRVLMVAEGEARGLNAAVLTGIHAAQRADAAAGVGVLLGDLPALTPAHLDAALAAAAEHASAFVADAEGTGTTLLCASAGVALAPAFGTGSAEAHRRLGHVQLPIPEWSTVHYDVDTPAALAACVGLGVGRATLAALDGIGRAAIFGG